MGNDEVEKASIYLSRKGLVKEDFIGLMNMRNGKDFANVGTKVKLRFTKECKKGRGFKRFGDCVEKVKGKGSNSVDGVGNNGNGKGVSKSKGKGGKKKVEESS